MPLTSSGSADPCCKLETPIQYGTITAARYVVQLVAYKKQTVYTRNYDGQKLAIERGGPQLHRTTAGGESQVLHNAATIMLTGLCPSLRSATLCSPTRPLHRYGERDSDALSNKVVTQVLHDHVHITGLNSLGVDTNHHG